MCFNTGLAQPRSQSSVYVTFIAPHIYIYITCLIVYLDKLVDMERSFPSPGVAKQPSHGPPNELMN